jgi:benzoyl-CoA 2,3-epoxidase subunit B
MLTEEAFHLFVGETGVERVIKKSIELTVADPNGDARARGGIDFATIQKYINFWFSSSVELFGGEISNNAADFFGAGLKGRYKEQSRHEDHLALAGTYRMEVPDAGRLVAQDVPLRNAMNEILRDEYVEDCERAVRKWNRHVEAAGLSFRFALPSRRFNRKMGIYASMVFDLAGNAITPEAFEAKRAEWLPTAEDRAYVQSLMVPCVEPGQFAGWIAPPAKGVEGKPEDFPYVIGEGVDRFRPNAPGGAAE